MTPPDVGDDQADHVAAAVHAKARFDHIYTQPDPRAYFDVLGGLGYREAEHCARIVTKLRPHLPTRSARTTVLDVCCSYGILGSLLGSHVTLTDMQRRYGDATAKQWTTEHLTDADRRWLTAHRREDPPSVIGVDIAAPAVVYGLATGALDRGWAEDLEDHDPSPDLAAALCEVDLITVAGGIGYITERTLARLLSASPSPPWVAALVVRMFPYDRIATALAACGLVTERLTTETFPRRRFASETEQQAVLTRLAAMGIDPAGREDEGWYHAELFLSRPPRAAAPPVEELLRDLASDGVG